VKSRTTVLVFRNFRQGPDEYECQSRETLAAAKMREAISSARANSMGALKSFRFRQTQTLLAASDLVADAPWKALIAPTPSAAENAAILVRHDFVDSW
jgi:hypothetical protein